MTYDLSSVEFFMDRPDQAVYTYFPYGNFVGSTFSFSDAIGSLTFRTSIPWSKHVFQYLIRQYSGSQTAKTAR